VEELVSKGVPPFRAQDLAKLDPGTMAMVLDDSAFDGWDTDALLRGIQCPVVLQHGDRPFEGAGGASAIYEGDLDRVMALIRNCEVVHIAGTGHVAWLTKPDEWNQALRRFIQQNSA
jgi:pimeloyl-ACP methyl ester carboxylesterase